MIMNPVPEIIESMRISRIPINRFPPRTKSIIARATIAEQASIPIPKTTYATLPNAMTPVSSKVEPTVIYQRMRGGFSKVRSNPRV